MTHPSAFSEFAGLPPISESDRKAFEAFLDQVEKPLTAKDPLVDTASGTSRHVFWTLLLDKSDGQ